MREQEEKRITEHNQKIKTFEEVIIDFQIRHPIHEFDKAKVFSSREPYAGYFILAVVEMLKYAIKEDYDN